MAHPLTRSYCEGGEGQVDTSKTPRISARSPVLPMIFTLEIVPSAPFVPRIFVVIRPYLFPVARITGLTVRGRYSLPPAVTLPVRAMA